MAHTPQPDPEPFHTQPVLSGLCESRDLLDFSAPITSTSPPAPAQHVSLFSSVTQLAAGVTGRAAAAAGATPPSVTSPTLRQGSPSPERRDSIDSPGTISPSAESSTEVRCVEGYGQNLYVGGSDGVVEHWVYDATAETTENRGWKLQHRHKVFPARPISKIVLLPKVGRVFVLSDGTLHPLSLPALEPLPPSVIAPLRGVVSVALNDDELDLGGPEGEITDMSVVVLRRRGLAICRLGNRMQAVKEIPLPSPTRHHALFGTYLCAALPSDGGGLTYSIIDLSDASMTEVLPVSQMDPADIDWKPNPNVVVIPGENQFLVTSFTGSNTMGVFLNGQGDPERGTMEWSEHPLSITVESGFIIALLRNNTICIHSLADLEKPAQIIPLDAAHATFALSYSPYGVSIRDLVRDERMSTSRFTLLSGKLAPKEASVPPVAPVQEDIGDMDFLSPGGTTPEGVMTPEMMPEEPPSGSGLTPPLSPKFKRQPINPPRSSSLLSSGAASSRPAPFSSAVAETLIVARHSVRGLAPMPTVLRLEHLCDQRRMDDAIALVDDERRRGRRGEIDVDKTTHSATMRLLHTILACHLLLDTVFERAGEYFIRGKVDARLVVRLFPNYRGKLIGTAEEVEVLDGLLPVLQSMGTIDEIIADYLKRNSEAQADFTTSEELRSVLYDSAKSMLTEFLRKTRTSRRRGAGSRGLDSRKIDIVIDTTLAKLLADAGITNELLALLASTNDVVLAELEPFLADRKYVLSTVMRQQGRTERVLELLKEIAEDPKPDPMCSDPVGDLVTQLETVQDPEMLRKYALWLVRRDIDLGLTILIAKGAQVNFDDAQLVNDLAEVSKEAANRYLEYVVVGKRSTDRDLHESLLRRLLDEAAEFVQDDGIKYHIEELDAEYRLLKEPEAYPAFFADIAPPTPFKTLRLKLMLFLQGSSFFDLDAAAKRLNVETPTLVLERAIVYGRLGRNSDALSILARELPDTVSAQTYCTSGGEILPPKVAKAIAARTPELSGWTDLAEGPSHKARKGSVDAATQQRLVLELLRAYMKDGEGGAAGSSGANSATRASALLAAQGVHLDVLEILDMAPGEWPLDAVTTFYKRSFRRRLHERTTWQILKSISAGQNMETSEKYLNAMRKVRPVLVDGPSDSHLSEKEAMSALTEKLGAQMSEKSGGEEEMREKEEEDGQQTTKPRATSRL